MSLSVKAKTEFLKIKGWVQVDNPTTWMHPLKKQRLPLMEAYKLEAGKTFVSMEDLNDELPW